MASLVLSMSKRIMNEVMVLADLNNIDIFTQDTDSMHIDRRHVEKLAELYKKQYNKELIGKSLGQFSSDFDSHILKNSGDIVAIKSIFLGKKSYIDVLYDGNSRGVVDYHIRMKGIPTNSIHAKCKEMGVNPYELYEKMFNGEAIEFNLCADENNNFKTKIKKYTMFGYKNISEFWRKVKFIPKGERLIVSQ